MDSSSAVLLHKADALTGLMNAYDLLIPFSVYREITVPGQTGSDCFLKYVENGTMQVSHDYKCCLINLPLSGGERDVVLLYLSGVADFVIIDDGKGAAYCRKNQIPFINALLTVRILYLNGYIDESCFCRGSGYLCRNARYSEKIIEYALHARDDEISCFFPSRHTGM